MRNKRLDAIETAILEIAVRIEAGISWYDSEHPEGIYQRVALMLLPPEKRRKKKPTKRAKK